MENIEEYIKSHQRNSEKTQSFVEYLYSLMATHNIENPSDIYNPANISRQLWSSIISEKSSPSLNACVKIALAMHLDNHECKYLLKKAGYTLASSNRFALIIRYAIENKIYDIYKVNELLMNNGCEDQVLI